MKITYFLTRMILTVFILNFSISIFFTYFVDIYASLEKFASKLFLFRKTGEKMCIYLSGEC